MNLLLKKSIWSYMATFLVVFFVGIVLFQQIKNVYAESSNEDRLITIYDRKQTFTVITKSSSLKEVLAQAKVALDPSDIVEPSLDEKLVSSNYYVNIYRARPVIIVDGQTKLKVMSAYQTPKQIASSVGVSLYPEDIATMKLSTDVVANGAGVEMIVTRAKQINVNMYGKEIKLRTQAKNISEFLKSNNIVFSEQDKISLDPNTPITDLMSFKIWREGKQTISSEEEVDYEIDEIKDANRYIGYREISTAGVKGSKNVTYEVEVLNGEIISKKIISSVVISQPTKQTVVVGIKYNGPDFRSTETKINWLKNAGISELDWGYVDFIISKESNWNPNSINRSSGACGLAQALPCGKVPGSPLDPVDNLSWANNYATKRYGSWEKAYNFWLVNKWW